MKIQFPEPSVFEDKVLACWIGKNCGGTLGGPLEKAYSQEEPFDIDFYPVIQEGGIPNDDLEIQLVWLKALEDLGFNLKAADMAAYWLDHVGYNPDEYGFMKTNLRLGLRPPVSGFYNNYFKHSMGCPIRTEIWACIAPGNPRLAAAYSLEDSICDHAGGESICGSLFNVTVESAAFVLQDRDILIDIGLSYIPEKSVTARCIRAALKAHKDGEDWLGARKRILEIGWNHNAQYSPPNIAFQVLGWLYGSEFGESLCRAVNCGYDTDCTGATLGSILGIVGGTKAISDKWTSPLGDGISTSDSSGGVKHFYTGPNPVPLTITELTTRVLVLQRKLEALLGKPSGELADLYADAAILARANASPTAVPFELPPRSGLSLDCQDSPRIEAEATKEILIEATHTSPEPVPFSISLLPKEGWSFSPSILNGVFSAETKWSGKVVVKAPSRKLLENSNEILFHVKPQGRPGWGALPLVLIGSPVYSKSEIFQPKEKSTESHPWIDQAFIDEELVTDVLGRDVRGKDWGFVQADGNDVRSGLGGFESGVVYLRGFLKSETERRVWIHNCTNVPTKVWVNGSFAYGNANHRSFRPWCFGYNKDDVQGEIQLNKGWNKVLLKYAREPGRDFQAHVMYSNHMTEKNDKFAGITDLLWTRFPWDE